MRHLPVACIALLASGCATAPFDLQGHRGARGLAPENTLPAFARALSIGVTTLEMDTNVTSDDVMVVVHDSSLNPDITRDADGQWLARRGPSVRNITYSQLMGYDVGRTKPGTRYAQGLPAQVPVDGTRIPRLAQVFDLARKAGNDQVRFNIETKLTPTSPDETLAPTPFARKLVQEIREAGLTTRATIQSFDWRTLQEAQRQAPEIATVYLTAQQKFLDNVCGGPLGHRPDVAPADCQASGWTASFQLADYGSVPKMVKAAGGRTWSPYYGDVDAAKVAEAKSLGIGVVVWTVNDPATIARMMDLGVTGIISDRPDLVREEMRKRGMALPAATPVAP
jgi:glycerophosphoryl diester phosphodiesterase